MLSGPCLLAWHALAPSSNARPGACPPASRDASFHFWDATDDITGANLDLLFERDRLYLHNASGSFGAVPMTLTGGPMCWLAQGRVAGPYPAGRCKGSDRGQLVAGFSP